MFVTCYIHNRHTTKMTKIWLTYGNSSVFTVTKKVGVEHAGVTYHWTGLDWTRLD